MTWLHWTRCEWVNGWNPLVTPTKKLGHVVKPIINHLQCHHFYGCLFQWSSGKRYGIGFTRKKSHSVEWNNHPNCYSLHHFSEGLTVNRSTTNQSLLSHRYPSPRNTQYFFNHGNCLLSWELQIRFSFGFFIIWDFLEISWDFSWGLMGFNGIYDGYTLVICYAMRTGESPFFSKNGSHHHFHHCYGPWLP